jgi:hypothetical protein
LGRLRRRGSLSDHHAIGRYCRGGRNAAKPDRGRCDGRQGNHSQCHFNPPLRKKSKHRIGPITHGPNWMFHAISSPWEA